MNPNQTVGRQKNDQRQAHLRRKQEEETNLE
jgi:hypothetical protein